MPDPFFRATKLSFFSMKCIHIQQQQRKNPIIKSDTKNKEKERNQVSF
jgi:hypothetical protein